MHLENLLALVTHELVLFAVRPQVDIESIGVSEDLQKHFFKSGLNISFQMKMTFPHM